MENMTPQKFVYWMQGFFELNNPTTIGEKETEIIKNKLNSLFEHEVQQPTNPNSSPTGSSSNFGFGNDFGNNENFRC